MILVAYRHGLRASELTDLRWDQVDFSTANLHVRRAKKGSSATHPILGDELRALRRLQREQVAKSPFVFTSERGAPFTTAGFARIVAAATRRANLQIKAHPHMLRHACSFKLANDGHDTRAAGLPGPQEHPAHGAVHRAVANAVQRFLALIRRGTMKPRGQTSAVLRYFTLRLSSYFDRPLRVEPTSNGVRGDQRCDTPISDVVAWSLPVYAKVG
jgi:hypothetical protein